METLKLFWFFLWRMVLWGLGLGVGLGAAYGLLVGTLFLFFMIFGPPLGALYGAMAGLPLGTLEGVVLWVVTVLHHRGGIPGDPVRYRRKAGLACAAACVMALALFFELVARRSGTSLVSGPAYDSDDVVFLLIMIVGPSLVASGAAWWAARRVAGQYARETAATRHEDETSAGGERPAENRGLQ